MTKLKDERFEGNIVTVTVGKSRFDGTKQLDFPPDNGSLAYSHYSIAAGTPEINKGR